jgi:hypothetical protein
VEQPKIGRPPKAVKEINPQVQFGRRPQADVDLVDAAAQAAGKSRAEWAWEILLRAAKRAKR